MSLPELKNIKIKGAKNVRDLGGITVNGGTLREKMIIRSGNLSKINSDGAAILKNEYRLKTVIDLRNSLEKAEKPNYKIDGITFCEMGIFDSSIPGLSHETKSDLSAVPDMRELYAAVVNSDCFNNICSVVRKIILLNESEFSVLFHCTEGKDRTGMVTAMLLTVLGAKREDILEEYLFTNKTNRKKAIGYLWLVRIFKLNPKAARKVYNVFVAKEEYLNELFKVIDNIGIEKLLTDYIKITEAELEAFKKLAVK